MTPPWTSQRHTFSSPMAAICGRDAARLREAAAEIDAVAIAADVSKENDVVRLVRADRATRRLRHADQQPGLRPLRVAARPSRTCSACMPPTCSGRCSPRGSRYFVAQQRGNIANVASTVGQRGFAGGTAYASSKFALSGLTECWRAELRKSNVWVMQIISSEV